MKKIITEKNLNYRGFTSVDMPNQYLLSSPVSTPEQTREYLGKILPTIEEIADTINKKEELNDNGNVPLPHLMSGIVNAACNKFMMTSKTFKVSDECIGCGKCEKRCPMGNITMTDHKPHFGSRCTWCFSCIQYCPKSAIDIKGKTEGKARYVCPEYKKFIK